MVRTGESQPTVFEARLRESEVHITKSSVPGFEETIAQRFEE